MIDYYAVLGVAPDADYQTIKTRYRRLTKEYHPDAHPGEKADEERFKEIGEAWSVLGDTDKRAEYDKTRAAAKQASGKSKTKGAPVGEVDFSDLMNKFDTFFGKAAAPSTGQNQTRNPLEATELFEKFMGFKKS